MSRLAEMLNPSRRKLLGLVACAAGAVVGYSAAQARATGIPTADPLVYSGRLEDSTGAPLTGSKTFELRLWSRARGGAVVCSTEPLQQNLEHGAFDIPLTEECVQAVRDNRDLWLEVVVDNTSFGRRRLGAVPYAVEADRAANTPVITDWEAYDSVVSDALGEAISGATTRAFWRRIGDSAEVKIETKFAEAASTTGTVTWSLPSGHVIDFTKHPGDIDYTGTGRTNVTAVNPGEWELAAVLTDPSEPTTVRVRPRGFSALGNVTFSPGHFVALQFQVPIVDWTATE